jgi:transcriptional regulator of acetoin/glycerol metabolism
LPKFTAAQRELLINIVVAAYEAGEMETAQYLYSVTLAEAQERSRRGVIARRAKSRRAAINAAAAKRQEVSIEQLAKEHGVSRATAYRALAMAASKPKK